MRRNLINGLPHGLSDVDAGVYGVVHVETRPGMFRDQVWAFTFDRPVDQEHARQATKLLVGKDYPAPGYSRKLSKLDRDGREWMLTVRGL